MPMYTYRREDGTTFEVRQKFLDEPLTVDPETGQPVVRVIHAAGVIFKGSGFYVTDNKSSNSAGTHGSSESRSNGHGTNGNGSNGSAEGKSSPEASKTETASESTKTSKETKAS